ncbi:MAG: CoA transferase [Deltaproteobacteria bacterium]|nr:CoA transferase [Deltaproteobacteria bacterium]
MNEKQPLEGVKVLDFTRVLTGPFATMILGDMGAEIIKVEPPHGDESRSWPPTLDNGESGYFMALNRNKKSITLNLKDPGEKKLPKRFPEGPTS